MALGLAERSSRNYLLTVFCGYKWQFFLRWLVSLSQTDETHNQNYSTKELMETNMVNNIKGEFSQKNPCYVSVIRNTRTTAPLHFQVWIFKILYSCCIVFICFKYVFKVIQIPGTGYWSVIFKRINGWSLGSKSTSRIEISQSPLFQVLSHVEYRSIWGKYNWCW